MGGKSETDDQSVHIRSVYYRHFQFISTIHQVLTIVTYIHLHVHIWNMHTYISG